VKKLVLLLVLPLILSIVINPVPIVAHQNNYQLHPLAGEYTVSVETTSLGNNSWIFEYSITNINQVGDWSGLTPDGLPPAYMNGIDFTGLSNFFVKVPHGAVISNVNLPASYGASHGVNPEYVYEWHMQGPWHEDGDDVYDWIMIYPYGFAEIYPRGETLVFSFRIDEVAVGVNEGRISTYYPDHMARYGNVPDKLNDCYTFQMTSPLLLPPRQIDEIQEFFNDSVDTGSLFGTGPGKSADGKLRALRNMLERAEELINKGLIDEAIQHLEDAYKKTDGSPNPPDFVSGGSASDLARKIQTLINTLRSL